tara:strand:- start:4 stop:189 length:186 start_codon:yes stop_codon:yes gene_type:complete
MEIEGKQRLLWQLSKDNAQCLTDKLSMPGIFGDDMVLQRNSKVALYGTANPGERVTIEVSW